MVVVIGEENKESEIFLRIGVRHPLSYMSLGRNADHQHDDAAIGGRAVARWLAACCRLPSEVSPFLAWWGRSDAAVQTLRRMRADGHVVNPAEFLGVALAVCVRRVASSR